MSIVDNKTTITDNERISLLDALYDIDSIKVMQKLVSC